MKWFHNNWKPYQVGIEPTNIGDLWAGDGSRFQLVCLSKDGKYKFKRYYFLVDVHARTKIVGAILHDAETTNLVLSTFQIAVKKTGFLPRE